jgi:hypothetical protein
MKHYKVNKAPETGASVAAAAGPPAREASADTEAKRAVGTDSGGPNALQDCESVCEDFQESKWGPSPTTKAGSRGQ